MKGPEAQIETSVSEYAERDLCILSLKLRLLGSVGWPDRVYFAYCARILFVEFKAPGEKARPIQSYIHQKLVKLGFNVYVIDDQKKGRDLLEAFAKGETLPKAGKVYPKKEPF